ncbi:hypothetical protein RJD38_02860 [Vibrio scophthalmi]|uniref:hypothetical protein n=1 Tax=Vibrio scophthalmi TaxID=45658 RepID=UPI00349F7EC0
MIRIIFLFFMAFSNSSYASWNVVPNLNLEINLKYDPYLKSFYDLTSSGSVLLDLDEVSRGEFKFKHGRDSYIGVSIPDPIHGWYENIQAKRHVTITTLSMEGVNSGVSKRFDILTTLGVGRYIPELIQRVAWWASADGCVATMGNSGVIINPNSISYINSWCNSDAWGMKSNAILSPGGTVERYFKFPLDELNKLPFGLYSGVLNSRNQEYLSSPDRGANADGHEEYIYTVNLEVRPSITNFTVDDEYLSFSITKQKTGIIGLSQTGFNIQGAFLNSQAFDLTLTSSNNALCSGELCLSNSVASTVIPYVAKVFDPSTLLEKRISRSGQKITIYSDKDYHLSGGLLFEFDTENTALSGEFNDILTVRVELKLI